MSKGKLKKRENGYWYVTLPDGRRVSTKQRKKVDAEIVAAAMLEKIRRQGSCRQLFSEYAQDFFLPGKCEWIKYKRDKNDRLSDTWISYRRGHLTKWLLPNFGKLTLSEFNFKAVQNGLQSMDVSNSMKNKILDSLSIIMRFAVRDGLIPANPVSKDHRYPVNDERARGAFTLEELVTLFPEDEEKLISLWGNWENAVYYAVLAFAGLRPSEAKALTRTDVRDGAIIIEKAFGADRSLGDVKTLTSQRAVPIPEQLKWIMDHATLEGTFLFPNFMRKTPRAMLRSFHTALEQANIDREGRNLVPYSFRHTFNTITVESMGEEQCRRFMGHASEKMTYRYLHLTKKAKMKKAQESAAELSRALLGA